MLERVSPSDSKDIPGTREFLRCNISLNGAVTNIGSGTKVGSCSWNSSYNCTNDDFESLDVSQLSAPRGANGVLPNINFMKPVRGSGLEGIGYYAN